MVRGGRRMKTRWKPVILITLLISLLCSISLSSSAQTAPGDSHLHIKLISERTALIPGKTTAVGLYFKLAPDWHIYWINAGDSGEPPRVLWTLPNGIAAGNIQWPTPQRLAADSLVNYGYTNSVLLIVPVAIRSTFTAREATLHADVNWLVCREICIPGISKLDLTLPVSRTSRPTASSTLFRQARANLPKKLPADWRATVSAAQDHFLLHVKTGKRLAKASFIPRHSLQVSNDAPQKLRSMSNGIPLTIRKSDELLSPIAQLDCLLVLGNGVSYDIEAPVTSKRVAQKN